MFLSYRNQSRNWFLYDGNIGRSRVKLKSRQKSCLFDKARAFITYLETKPEDSCSSVSICLLASLCLKFTCRFPLICKYTESEPIGDHSFRM